MPDESRAEGLGSGSEPQVVSSDLRSPFLPVVFADYLPKAFESSTKAFMPSSLSG